jgi:hypothetical protein
LKGGVVAYIWSVEGDGVWWPMSLDDRGHDVPPARIARQGAPDDGAWVVLGPSSVRVNGAPLDLGIRVLADRDELRVGGARVFFSTETRAAIEPYPGSERTVLCPRCKLQMMAGTPAVRCPKCHVWHHQSAEPDGLPCWTYTEHCAADCDQPTALDAGFRWTPEDGL